MSKWPGKYVIGLTGNIGTGKSVVRKMLEHLGAYGIDADALSHRAMSKGAPGYKPVVELFGHWIVASDGQIDRMRLGRIAFADPEALKALEDILHPLVFQAVDLLTRRASQPVVVIEAIKLLETRLSSGCDSIWVTNATPEVQMIRLVSNRKMSPDQAKQRIQTQPSQESKNAQAQIIIKNDGSITDTWRQVYQAWQQNLPSVSEPAPVKAATHLKGQLTIERGRPRHSSEIAALINLLTGDHRKRTADDIMAAFGEKAFLLLRLDQKLVGVVGWQVENLVARTTDLFIQPDVSIHEALPPLIAEMERASKDLQCEASLVFVSAQLISQNAELWKQLGYETRRPTSLTIQAWQEAALESQPVETQMLFKQLRQDRILRPI